MKIGDYTLYSIETSEFGLDGGAMFGIIPKPLWEKQAQPDSMNRISMVTRSLLLVSSNHKILIDTGNGNKWADKYQKIYNIDLTRYNIVSSLNKYGFMPDDITDVFCTHLHFDHAGGNTRINGEKIEPTFPNAKYWVSQENWNLANHPSQKDQGSFLEWDWRVIAENNMLNIVVGDEPFLPGIDLYFTHGHTKGLMHPLLQDDRTTLFYGADLIPMAAHIPVPWIMAYDIHPALTAQEKEELLSLMVQENWILFFEHDPHFQACTIELDGKHYCMKDSIVVSD